MGVIKSFKKSDQFICFAHHPSHRFFQFFTGLLQNVQINWGIASFQLPPIIDRKAHLKTKRFCGVFLFPKLPQNVTHPGRWVLKSFSLFGQINLVALKSHYLKKKTLFTNSYNCCLQRAFLILAFKIASKCSIKQSKHVSLQYCAKEKNRMIELLKGNQKRSCLSDFTKFHQEAFTSRLQATTLSPSRLPAEQAESSSSIAPSLSKGQCRRGFVLFGRLVACRRAHD